MLAVIKDKSESEESTFIQIIQGFLRRKTILDLYPQIFILCYKVKLDVMFCKVFSEGQVNSSLSGIQAAIRWTSW